MSIIPDLILAALQALPFLVLMGGLWVILFKPMLAYLEAREHATHGARHEAEALAAKAEARLAEYEKALEQARAEVAEFRAQRRAAAQAKYGNKVAEARKAAEIQLSHAMGRINEETEAARALLRTQVRGLAQDAATQVLGRPLQVEA